MELPHASKAARFISESDFVRVVAHHDADGISTAGIVCRMVLASEGRYHSRIIEDPSEVSEHASEDTPTIFCDLGAAYLDQLPGNTVVIDHHPQRGEAEYEGTLVTPRYIDQEASSSCAAYVVARSLGVKLADIALVGAIGDDILYDDLVREVIERGVEDGVIEVGEGIRLVGDNPAEALAYSTDPYTEYSGDFKGARNFLNDRGLGGSIGEMDENQLSRFSTSVVLLATKNENASVETIESLVGEKYTLTQAPVRDAHTLSSYIEACGKMDKGGLGLSLCVGEGDTEEVKRVYRSFQSNLIETIENVDVNEGDPTVVRVETDFDTGPVADVFHRWITGERGDVIVINTDGHASMRSRTTDAGECMRESASRVGGTGGGHPSRGGANVPKQKISEFTRIVRSYAG
ncbi:MAG: DHHA1 domain-containing protein [Halobacteria archaeon]|nr:DHHA1 domain-containing protein [Halobacteria archaeon]